MSDESTPHITEVLQDMAGPFRDRLDRLTKLAHETIALGDEMGLEGEDTLAYLLFFHLMCCQILIVDFCAYDGVVGVTEEGGYRGDEQEQAARFMQRIIMTWQETGVPFPQQLLRLIMGLSSTWTTALHSLDQARARETRKNGS